MENRIKDYEEFINCEIEERNRSSEIREYHRSMVQNFQHERLVHLIITLFFAALTLVMIALSVLSLSAASVDWLVTAPCLILTAVLAVLTFFYVKHYYFLENHIQRLYDLEADLCDYRQI